MRKLALILISVFTLNIFLNTLVFWENLDELIKQHEQKIEKQKKLQKEKTMQAWMKQKQQMIKDIYNQTNIAYLMDLNQAAQQLSNISSKLEDTSLSYRSIKIQKNNIDKKYKAVLEAAKQVIIKLREKDLQMKKKLLKIQILSKELENLKNQISEIKTTIYISKKQVAKYVSVLYKINNEYYNSVDSLDDIKLLLKSSNISQTLSQEDILKLLSLKTQELLIKLEKSQKIKSNFLRKIYITRVEYINTVNEYKTELTILNNKRKMLVDLLTMLKTNKKAVDKYYDRIFKKRVNLKKRQVELLNSIKDTKNWTWNSIHTKAIDLSAILKYTTQPDGDKFFNWPSRDYRKITAYFHDKNYFKKFGWQHDGIDIAMPQWTPIYAPAAGYVYKVVDNNSTYYNYIVIVHNYWYISIYGHISKALVKKWQIVKRGQIIALSGGEKWTRWSWKMSTWPHLHFELYKNWQHIDPLSVLDLSVYPNKQDVPEKWRLKYIKDSLTRKVDLSNIRYYPKWLIHKQREQLFLRRAASWFSNLTGWVSKWKQLWIDPDVAICIGYAESWLGHNMSSPNNVWNVWNNDRWDRVWFATPQDWINAIYYALNNKYLSKYFTIDRLSRYWNKDSHIYSSSSYNWYKNVVKCLTIIKWYPINELYPFRILSNSEKRKLAKIKNIKLANKK